MAKKLSQEEFEKEIYKLYKDEYQVVSEYKSSHHEITILHKKCGESFTYSSAIYFKQGRYTCPYCTDSHVSINTDVYKYKVSKQTNDEYSVLGEYKNATTKIKMRHNKCICSKGFYEWDISPHSFLDGNHRCPYESHQQGYTIDDFKMVLKEKHPDYICVGEKYINSCTPINVICSKGHSIKMSMDGLKANTSCCICTNKVIQKGINDLNTTHPILASYLVNKEYGEKYGYWTRTKLDFICPNCGNIVHKIPSTVLRNNHDFICICGDGFSYPEKFMSNVLKQLNINYMYQITSKDFAWCGKYRYDFFIPEINMIIETHGKQHYQNVDYWNSSINQINRNDEDKMKLALSNGCNYCVIDMKYSTKEYCKKSILCTELSQIYDFNLIDWDEADIFASKSILISISNDWNNGLHDIKIISQKYKIHTSTVYRYLEKANDLNICKFNKDEYIHITRSKSSINSNTQNIKIKSIETGIIYNSFAEAKRLANAFITQEILNNPNRTSAKQHWISI